MVYVALIRGINVGGKNIIRMDRLRACFHECGLEDATTFIQSGNVVFDSGEKSIAALEKRIETAIARTFKCASKAVVRSLPQLKAVLAGVPSSWKGGDLRRNIAFVKAPSTPAHVMRAIQPQPGVDFLTAGKGVVYMGTSMSALKKSALPKLVTKPVYQDLTIRNHNTCQRLLELMEAR